MMVGAFKLSLVDMIKKTRYNYEHPIDYLDVFISSTYHPGRNVDITLTDDIIKARCSGPIDMQLIEKLEKRKILALAAVIPPTRSYEKVELRSGGKRVSIDNDRQVSTDSCDVEGGSLLTIWRMKNKESEEKGTSEGIDEEIERIRYLYAGSDMKFTLNEKLLTPERNHDSSFEEAGFRGIISYDPYSTGKINYFVKGRKITSEDFLSGIDLDLHGHSLKHTITKSRVLTKRGAGKKEYKRLQQILPKLLLDYLNSDIVKKIHQESISSYQTILRSVFRKYFEDSNIIEHVKKNIRFANKIGQIDPDYTFAKAARQPDKLLSHEKILYEEITGLRQPSQSLNDAELDEYRQYCAELQSMLNINVQPTGGETISYDSKRVVVFVPVKLFDEQGLFETGLSVVNQIELSPRRRLTLFRNIVRTYRN